MNKRYLLFVEIGVVVAVVFLLAWVILPKFIGAQNMNTPRTFPDDYMRASVERFMGVGTFEPFTRTQLEEKPGQLAITNSHNFTGLEHLKSINSLSIHSESPTNTPVAAKLPNLPNVYFLTLSGSSFGNLDASKLTGLKHLQIIRSPIESLSLNGLEKLEFISMSGVTVSSLNLTGHPNLKQFYLSRDNSIDTVDLSENKKLETLKISFSSLDSIDLSSCPELEELDLRSNQLSTVDLSKNPKLKEALVGNDTLESVNFVECKSLEVLDISRSKISEIDIVQNQNLKELFINHTPINSIDASKNPNLQRIAISIDQLFSMDISYVNPNIFVQIIPPFQRYTIEKIDTKKREIFKANFPDLNPDDYVFAQP